MRFFICTLFFACGARDAYIPVAPDPGDFTDDTSVNTTPTTDTQPSTTIPCTPPTQGPFSIMTVENQRSEPVSLFYRNGDCEESASAVVEANSSYELTRYGGEVWVVRTAQGELLTWFEVWEALVVTVQ